MKWLVDQQLPPGLSEWLIKNGEEATHVRDIGLRDAEDDAIWRRAVLDGLIIATKDEDFARRRAQTDGPSVVWLRIGNATNRELFAWLAPRWPGVLESLRDGAGLVEVR